ncbi:MAG: hypothetical protein MJH10_18810 [Epibacterium sp.]|nr:hypothetical protein [Epibacterium sp.]NQX75536.1 hypothetical protein [Epibacterium sp.]
MLLMVNGKVSGLNGVSDDGTHELEVIVESREYIGGVVRNEVLAVYVPSYRAQAIRKFVKPGKYYKFVTRGAFFSRVNSEGMDVIATELIDVSYQ